MNRITRKRKLNMDNGWTRLGDLCENSCKEIRNFTIELDHNKMNLLF